MINLKTLKKEPFAVLFIIILSLAWLSLILAYLGIFYKIIIWFYALVALATLIYLIPTIFKKNKFSKIDLFFLASIILTVIVFSFFTEPSVFSGRDQGSLSEAAIKLSQDHQLKSSFPVQEDFFQIYGPGQALNFPGFSYTTDGKLVTQFPLGYIVWLAAFFSLFGLKGLVIANGVSFFVFSSAFYLLAKKYLSSRLAWISWALVATTFTSFWFFKFTLSENLALALLWAGIYFFIAFWEKHKKIFLVVSLLSFGFLLFTRIEGLAFLAMVAIITFWKLKKNPSIKKIFDKKIVFLLGGILVLYILNLFINSQFFISIFKAVFKPILDSRSEIFSFSETLKIFYLYNLLPFFLLGLAGFFWLIKKKKFENIIPFLIVLPAFFYVLFPFISGDHPWMLRRFIFAAVPVSILYSVILLDNLFLKKIFSRIFLFLLLLGNFSILLTYLTFIPHQSLLAQTEKLSHNFGKDDLILVDQKASGSNWSMLSGPLNFAYNKQAVYFFNLQDLEKINLEKYSDVYLIIPDGNLDFYLKNGFENRLEPIQDYFIKNSLLDSLDANNLQLPAIKNISTSGKIYLLK